MTNHDTEPFVTPGHPTMAGAGYNCNCGQCLHARTLAAAWPALDAYAARIAGGAE